VKSGIIICSRLDSSRLPNKAVTNIIGIPLIEHLIKRLIPSGIKIYIAVPKHDFMAYIFLSKYKEVEIYPSLQSNDPLKRMHECAEYFGIKQIVRISHDKIFVNYPDINAAINYLCDNKLDYVYSSKFIAGSGFEVISAKALEKASSKYSKVEFIGYAIRSVTNKIGEFNPRHPSGDYRLLIDYPEDLKLMEVLFSTLGIDCNLVDAVKYLNVNPELKFINKLPKLTLYTCVYNAEEFIERCMSSVCKQRCFRDIEYIIIDDCSTDNTLEKIAKLSVKFKNIRWIKNNKNLGLASSSNIALKEARGKYIMRLDADDFFVSIHAIESMVKAIENTGADVIYPHNYFGSFDKIQDGNESHHVGGAIFNKNAINHIKFTDGLRGYDGLDVFTRSKNQIKIDYLEKPIFFYRQRPGSLSKSNPKLRAKIKSQIEGVT